MYVYIYILYYVHIYIRYWDFTYEWVARCNVRRPVEVDPILAAWPSNCKVSTRAKVVRSGSGVVAKCARTPATVNTMRPTCATKMKDDVRNITPKSKQWVWNRIDGVDRCCSKPIVSANGEHMRARTNAMSLHIATSIIKHGNNNSTIQKQYLITHNES